MLWTPPIIPNPIKAEYFDDFAGVSYENRLWTATGTGSITQLDALGGRVRIRGNTNNTYRIFHNAFGSYTVGANARAAIYGSMTPAVGANGLCECGFQTAASPTLNYVKWQYEPNASSFFKTVCMSGGTATITDSNVAGDNNNHRFEMVCSTGAVWFYLDGVLRMMVINNIPAGSLQPFVGSTGSAAAVSDFNLDWLECTGDRA